MRTTKLSSTDAFVVVDLDDAPCSVGIVRQAPKVLVDGAVWLARSLTYQFAVLGQQVGGASAGVNAAEADADGAVASFTEELAPQVAAGTLALHPGKGVRAEQLGALRAVEPSPRPLVWESLPQAIARSAVAAAEAAQPLEGRRVAVESLDEVGLAAARVAEERGARIVSVATTTGTVSSPDGFSAAALAEAIGSVGPDGLASLGFEVAKPWSVLGADADVVFVGSKAGAIDYKGAGHVRASLVVPTGAVPVTAKAFAALTRAGTVVLPDFVTTAGIAHAHLAGATVDLDTLGRQIDESVTGILRELAQSDEPVLLAACRRAEAFLAGWTSVPFGRPLA